MGKNPTKPAERKPLEQRTYQFEIRADETEQGGIILGRPIVYEQKTDLGYFNEVIARGALDGTDLTDVRFLVNHDISRIPLARSRRNNGNSTMQLTTDFEGLAIRVQLDIENNADARALYSAVKRGDITGMSFMFSVLDERWEDLESDHPTRTILKLGTVVEVSAVTFPAYEQTEISARGKLELESAKLTLDSVRSQRKNPVETREIELWKAKINNLAGGF